MSGGYGGYANVVHPTAPGLPCVHCEKDVNVTPFRFYAGRPTKIKPTEEGEPERRPNPERRSLISRVVCSPCYKKGKR